MTDKNNDSIMCPSSKMAEGALLLGIRQENGIVAILPKAIDIDHQNFLKSDSGSSVEQHFRFANACMKNGCKQWTGKKCRVAIKAIHYHDKPENKKTLLDCSIRNQCRWYLQEGDSVCHICPKIITDVTAEEIDTYFANEFH